MEIPRVFVGYDKRAPLAYNILQHSIVRHSSGPVAITPLIIDKLPSFNKVGLTEFTFSRYLVPYLCNFEGSALFVDSDMLVMGDIYELFQEAKSGRTVYVVKSSQRFEWPSVMLYNCDQCKELTPEYVSNDRPQSFKWANTIGQLDPSWNHLVGYDNPNPNAKLIHFTMGIPEFPECREHEHCGTWRAEKESALKLPSWIELMGTSVHREHVLQQLEIGAP